MSSRFILPFANVGSGIKPSSGAKLFFFETDGVTPKDTFSDQLSTPTPNANPVISDSNGVFSDIYIVGDYKVTLENKNGSQIFGGANISELITGSGQSNNILNRRDLSSAINDKTLRVGNSVIIEYRVTASAGGGAIWDVYEENTYNTGAFIFDVVNHVSLPLQLKLRVKDGVFNVVEFGAVGDDYLMNPSPADDQPAIQATYVAAVEHANATAGGATVVYPPLPYFVKGTNAPLPAGENTLDRYNNQQNGLPVGRVENIHVRGFGAKVRCDTATFVPSFPFCMTAFIVAPNCSHKGLIFESDLNDGVPSWIDSGNYFNKGVPTVTGEYGLVGIRCSNFVVKSNTFLNMEVGLTITDDRDGSHTFPNDMQTYNTIVTENNFKNCWTLMSMSNGSNEAWKINNNNLDYGFIKIVSTSDTGRGIIYTDNTHRDISGIMLLATDVIFKDNTFNNFLGGFLLAVGGDGQTVYNYAMRNVIIDDNICYSDHETLVNDGAATVKPQALFTFNASAANAGGQELEIDGFTATGNKADLWPIAGSSNGSFINRSGTADMVFKSPKVNGNDITLNNNLGVAVAIGSVFDYLTTRFEGTFQFKDNKIKRTVAESSAFEFQFMSGTFNATAVLDFSGNQLTTLSTNRQVVVGNFSKLIARSNNFYSNEGTGTTNTMFWTRSVPKVEMDVNEQTKFGATGNIGYMLYFDGINEGVYDPILDNAVVKLNDNRMTSGASTFSSPLTFPASAKGLYEFDSNIIRNAAGGVSSDYPNLTGFPSENVANPSRLAPTALDVALPRGYVVRAYNNTGPIGWHWSGTWTALPNF